MGKKETSVTEFARSGGKATLKKHGKKHFKELAKKRWAKVRLAKGEVKL